MRKGDPVHTPAGQAVVDSFTRFKRTRFGRTETVAYVYVRYPDDTIRIWAAHHVKSKPMPDFDPHVDYPERYTEGRPV
jgi:hypothetical protein